MTPRFCLVLVLLASCLAVPQGHAQAQLSRDAVSSLGAAATSGALSLSMTVGQPVVGSSSGETWTLSDGFWLPAADTAGGSVHPETHQLADKVSGPAVSFRTALGSNFPNPFNPVTRIAFEIGSPTHARLRIFNARGRFVKELVNEQLAAGRYDVVWDGTDQNSRAVASGVYYGRFDAGDYSSTVRLALLK